MSVHGLRFRPQDVLGISGGLPNVFVERKPVRHGWSRRHRSQRFFPELLERLFRGWMCRAVVSLFENAKAERQARWRDRPLFLRQGTPRAPGPPLLQLPARLAWRGNLQR